MYLTAADGETLFEDKSKIHNLVVAGNESIIFLKSTVCMPQSSISNVSIFVKCEKAVASISAVFFVILLPDKLSILIVLCSLMVRSNCEGARSRISKAF